MLDFNGSFSRKAMDNYQSASKKPRLDNNWEDELENDDFWDQGEITAEEFDMIEVQASQAVQNLPATQINRLFHNASNSRNNNTANNSINTLQHDADNLKILQYELEGKIKILNESLSKAQCDLNKERSDRNDLIKQRLAESKATEDQLQKEIERLRTTLQFQEQEMKSMHNKSKALEQKLKQSISNNFPCSPSTSKRVKFPNKFQFEKGTTITLSTAVQTNDVINRNCNEFKLTLMSTDGKLQTSSIVSQLLLNRSRKPLKPSSAHQQLRCNQLQLSSWFKSSLSDLSQFNSGKVTEESWRSYDLCLKQHVVFLRNLSNNSPLAALKTSSIVFGHLSIQSPENEAELQHIGALNSLKDIAQILLSQRDSSGLKITNRKDQVGSKVVGDSSSESGCSNPLFGVEEEKIDVNEALPLCLSPLITLAKPAIYPNSYCYKSKEIEWALNSLVIWSAQKPVILVCCLEELPIYQLVSGQCSIPSACLTLQLLNNLMHLTKFKKLIHKIDLCLITGVSDLCRLVGENLEGNSLTVNVIQEFLCTAVSKCQILEVKEEECSCSFKIVQEFIILLWRICYSYLENDTLQIHRNVLEKGVQLLYHFSNKIRNFQEKRCPVEDQYISLICMLSRLVKEKTEFKTLHGYIHELWDFQEDSGEFSGEDHNNDAMQTSTQL